MQCEGRVKAWIVKERSKRVQGKVKVRSRQHNDDLSRNYNLMGFDTIEINLVITCEHLTMECYLIIFLVLPDQLTKYPGTRNLLYVNNN